MAPIHEEQINNKYILDEGRTSLFIFMLPIFILIISILYVFQSSKEENNYIVLIVSIPFFVTSVLNYLNKKIILTKTSVYYFVNKKSVFFSKLSTDFKIFDIKQTKIEKILNYGTLYIFNNNGEFIEYKFFNDPLNFRKKFVKAYVEEMKKIDPSFEIEGEEYNNAESNKLDKIE